MQHAPMYGPAQGSAAPPVARTKSNQRETDMAQIARNNEAKKATDNAAELGKHAAGKGVDVAREAMDRTEDTARRIVDFAQQTRGASLDIELALTRRST